jgi:hypothetical protein
MDGQNLRIARRRSTRLLRSHAPPTLWFRPKRLQRTTGPLPPTFRSSQSHCAGGQDERSRRQTRSAGTALSGAEPSSRAVAVSALSRAMRGNAAIGARRALCARCDVSVGPVDLSPLRRPVVARRAVRRRVSRLGSRFSRLRPVRPLSGDGAAGNGEPAIGARRGRRRATGSRRPLCLRAPAGAISIADRPFLGHDRRRPTGRNPPGRHRSARLLRPDRLPSAPGRAAATCPPGG